MKRMENIYRTNENKTVTFPGWHWPHQHIGRWETVITERAQCVCVWACKGVRVHVSNGEKDSAHSRIKSQ